MASIEGRGFAGKIEVKEGASGPYCRFQLAVQQKYKDKNKVEVKETLYWRCVSFKPECFPTDGEYMGVTGYVTLTKWDGGQSGKGGVNVDVTVQSVERLAQREGSGAGRKAASSASDAPPPSDPFALSPEKP